MHELIQVIPRAVCMLSLDMLSFFSWWFFLGTAAAYSAVVFTGEMSKDGPLIFSRTNSRPLGTILCIHALFLSILLAFMILAPRVDGVLPNWMTQHIARAGTPFEIVFLVGMIVLGLIERRLLYIRSDVSAEHQNS